jgi:hypothetical protein
MTEGVLRTAPSAVKDGALSSPRRPEHCALQANMELALGLRSVDALQDAQALQEQWREGPRENLGGR